MSRCVFCLTFHPDCQISYVLDYSIVCSKLFWVVPTEWGVKDRMTHLYMYSIPDGTFILAYLPDTLFQ